jgi:hypothetical protein
MVLCSRPVDPSKIQTVWAYNIVSDFGYVGSKTCPSLSSTAANQGERITFTGMLATQDGDSIPNVRVYIKDEDTGSGDDNLGSITTGSDGQFSFEWDAKQNDPLDRVVDNRPPSPHLIRERLHKWSRIKKKPEFKYQVGGHFRKTPILALRRLCRIPPVVITGPARAGGWRKWMPLFYGRLLFALRRGILGDMELPGPTKGPRNGVDNLFIGELGRPELARDNGLGFSPIPHRILYL